MESERVERGPLVELTWNDPEAFFLMRLIFFFFFFFAFWPILIRDLSSESFDDILNSFSTIVFITTEDQQQETALKLCMTNKQMKHIIGFCYKVSLSFIIDYIIDFSHKTWEHLKYGEPLTFRKSICPVYTIPFVSLVKWRSDKSGCNISQNSASVHWRGSLNSVSVNQYLSRWLGKSRLF